MGNCVEVCKLTLRHTPGMGPSPQPHRPSQSQPMEVTPLNGFASGATATSNGSIRRPSGKEKYRPKPLPSRAIQNQAQMFRKRMCDDIRPPTPSQIRALEQQKEKLDHIVSAASKIIDTDLPSLASIYTKRLMSRARKIVDDATSSSCFHLAKGSEL